MSDSDLPPDSKLTRTKEKWARAGQFLTGKVERHGAERLPPGQHLVNNWPVLDLGLLPNVAPERWQLHLTGLVEEPAIWNWDCFRAQKQTDETTDIHCVTTWSRYDNRWTGVSTRDVLALVKPKPEAAFVVLHSYDGYTTNLPLEDFAAADAILAHSWNERPLEKEHGGPVRLVVPHLYFWKSAKWLQRIEFRARNELGFWEVRGYHERGDPWAEERYSD